jgi:DNA-binding LacI/PurR family transcriptional regulator
VHDRISERTRARVYDAAERLGYVPNAVASALRAGRTELVLLALPSWPLGQAVAEFVTAGVTEFERLGYTPLVHFQAGGDSRAFARACDRVRPVALIAPEEDLPPARVTALRENGTRAVLAIASKPLEHVATLVVDQAAVGEVAMTHLVEHGHERIVVVMPTEPQFVALGAERLRGAQAYADAHGVSVYALHVPCDPGAIAAALADVEPQRPTALYAFNDDFAVAALEALDGAEVAVIGTDDSDAARRVGLTTVAFGAPDHWKRIAARLLETIESGADDRSALLERPRVIQRASA